MRYRRGVITLITRMFKKLCFRNMMSPQAT